MGCGDSKVYSNDEAPSRRERSDSVTSWSGIGNTNWDALFASSIEEYNLGNSFHHRIPRKIDVKIKNRVNGAIQTRELGDCSLGIKGNRTTEEFLKILQPGEQFIDDEFGPKNGSIYYDTPDEYEWKRPKDLSSDAQMMVRGTDSRDVRCGFHTNTWFLQPLAVISGYSAVIKRVIVEPAPLNDSNHSGMIQFRFWRFGDWTRVYVDDRLPVNEHGELMYAHSEDPDEFWVPLVEKAYAKLHGCYEAIECGDPVDAFTDLTGGLVERYSIDGADPIVYHKMGRALGAGSLVSCTRKGDWTTNMEGIKHEHLRRRALEAEEEADRKTKQLEAAEMQYHLERKSLNIHELEDDGSEKGRKDSMNGMAEQVHSSRRRSRAGSAKGRVGNVADDKEALVDQFDPRCLLAENLYRVTMIRRVARAKGTELLLRLRNTWTQGEEWKGAWCDGDHRWELLRESTKNAMQYKNKVDGVFWMSYSDFCKHFKDVMICTIPMIADENADDEAYMGVQSLASRWREGVDAGGARSGRGGHFERNPQFELKVFAADPKDPTVLRSMGDQEPYTSSVVINLMQEYRKTEKHKDIAMLHIGFSVYSLLDGEHRLSSEAIASRSEIGSSGPHQNSRNVSARFELPPGRYAVVPSTFQPDQSSPFLLRAACAKRVEITEMPAYSITQDRKIMEASEESGQGSADEEEFPEVHDLERD